MRMIKCEPQPLKVTNLSYTVYKEYQAFHFDNVAGEKIFVPAKVSPDNTILWELRCIDNVWYWVKE